MKAVRDLCQSLPFGSPGPHVRHLRRLSPTTPPVRLWQAVGIKIPFPPPPHKAQGSGISASGGKGAFPATDRCGHSGKKHPPGGEGLSHSPADGGIALRKQRCCLWSSTVGRLGPVLSPGCYVGSVRRPVVRTAVSTSGPPAKSPRPRCVGYLCVLGQQSIRLVRHGKGTPSPGSLFNHVHISQAQLAMGIRRASSVHQAG